MNNSEVKVEKAKVITMCGSYKYMKEIVFHTERLELEGNCVLAPIDLTKDKSAYTPKDFNLLGLLHKQKIDMSDAIFVVNVNGYIGDSTKSEIEYAMQKGKEILYLEN